MDLGKNPNKGENLFSMPEKQFPKLFACPLHLCLVMFPSLMCVCLLSAVTAANSRQRRNGCPGEPGWDPEASAAVPQRRALAAVPVLPGERPPAPRAAGPTPLVTAGKGRQHGGDRSHSVHKWGHVFALYSKPYSKGLLQHGECADVVQADQAHAGQGFGGAAVKSSFCSPGEGVSQAEEAKSPGLLRVCIRQGR